MCDQCDPYFKPVPIGADAAFREQHGRIQAAVADDILEALDGEPWPGGAAPPRCLRQTYACTRCAQLFILERGGCSAFGDQWRPLYGN